MKTTMLAFKVLPLGSNALMPAPTEPIKTILVLVLWNSPQSCRCIAPDVIRVIKMSSFQYFGNRKSDPVNRQVVPTVACPEMFFGVRGFQQIQLRAERMEIWGQ
jgi:hypothetical protein